MEDKSIILLQSVNDVEAYLDGGEKADSVWPLNPLSWTAARNAGLIECKALSYWLPSLKSNWCRDQIDFEFAWPTVQNFIAQLRDVLGKRPEWPALYDTLVFASKPDLWNLVHEYNHTIRSLSHLIGMHPELIQIKAFEQTRSAARGASATNVAIAFLADRHDIEFDVLPSGQTEAPSRANFTPECQSKRCDDVFLTFGVPDLADRLTWQAKLRGGTKVLVTEYNSGNIEMIFDICERFENLEFCLISDLEIRSVAALISTLCQAYSEDINRIWDEIEIGEEFRQLVKAYIFEMLPNRIATYSIVRTHAGADKSKKFIFANHLDASTVALQSEAASRDTKIEKIEHSYWPLIDAYTLPDQSGETRVFHLQSAIEQLKNAGKFTDNYDLKPSTALRPDVLRRAKRLTRSAVRVRSASLGVLLTAGLLHVAADTDIHVELKLLVDVLSGDKSLKTRNILLRYRQNETSKEYILSVLEELGFNFDQYSVDIMGMEDCSIIEFALRCNLVVELGVASSAWALIASTACPYVRLAQQPDVRKRFKNRAVPVVNQQRLFELMNSLGRRTSMGLRQYAAYLADTGGN